MRLPGTAGRLAACAIVALFGGVAILASAAPIRLVGVSARVDEGAQAVLIESSEPAAYVIRRPDPLTVVVDLRGVSLDEAARAVPVRPGGPVSTVDLEQVTAPDGAPLARVRLKLAEPVPHRVRSSRTTIRIDFPTEPETETAASPDAATLAVRPASALRPVEPAPVPVPAALAVAEARAMASVLERVSATAGDGTVVVTLSGDGYLQLGSVGEADELPPRVVVDLPGVSSTTAAQVPVPYPPLERVRVGVNSRNPLVTRVVVDLSRMTSYRVERKGSEGDEVALVFEPGPSRGAILLTPPKGLELIPELPPIGDVAAQPTAGPASIDGAPAVAGPATIAAAPAPAAVGSAPRESPPSVAPSVSRLAAAAPHAIDPMAALNASRPAVAQAPAPAQPPQAPPVPAAQRFTGFPVTLDFQEADLRSVLRTFAEISGLNMVIDPAVQGTVDIVLSEVPWDQALDIILRGNKLGYTVEGTVVRIVPLSVLADEESQRQKLAEAQALAGELHVLTRPLSYARATVLAPLITRSALSQRGDVQVDERTNTLIIRDLQEYLDQADRLIRELDRPEPQVEIEARIVQTTRDFARSLGIQWGMTGRVAPDLGNTTSLAFPNRGVLGGRTGASQGPTDPRAGNLEQTGSAVNLPIPGATSAVGLMLSSINGSLNLDVALSALERSGKGRILSTPRVTTQNNIEAEVAQGLQIPIQTIANNTVTVTFRDAVLSLRVTPQITASDTVIMRIQLENATPDFSRQVNNIPPIDTQRATTQVQVNDGATTVIGGIFVSREQTLNERTPFFHRIPLLGWLFRRDTSSDESRELLIFITPRIMKG